MNGNKFDGRKPGPADHHNDNGNPLETCPDCGGRSRNPKHPLCFACNGKFNETQSALLTKAMNGEDVEVPDRLEYALKRAKETLAKKKEEATAAQKEADGLTKPLLEKARADIKAVLKGKGVYDVDSKVYGQKVSERLALLLNDRGEKVKADAASRRAFGCGKAAESLEKFIKAAELELQARKAAMENGEDVPVVDEDPQEPDGSGKQT